MRRFSIGEAIAPAIIAIAALITAWARHDRVLTYSRTVLAYVCLGVLFVLSVVYRAWEHRRWKSEDDAAKQAEAGAAVAKESATLAREAEKEFDRVVASFGRDEKSLFLALMRMPEGFPRITTIADGLLRIARPLVFYDQDTDRVRLRPVFSAPATTWTKAVDREIEIFQEKIAMVRQVNSELADKMERENQWG